jgi:hypothetical protein
MILLAASIREPFIIVGATLYLATFFPAFLITGLLAVELPAFTQDFCRGAGF